MKVAQAKLKEIGPDDMNMEEYKVSLLHVYRANAFISKAKQTDWLHHPAVPPEKLGKNE